MQGIEISEQMGEFFFDDQRKVPDAHRFQVCKFKKGEETCRYLSLSVKGYVCVKKTPMKQMLDNRVEEEKMSAKGDNCEGLGKLVLSFKENEEND
tara:strand:- start:9728 stop:10012 length:285 start_codon:yes stop_codon:yes gene_type:complete